MWLVLGSLGISCPFLNHWYWDLGKPSSSTQLSSADFPNGTDLGTLHFGITGFTVGDTKRKAMKVRAVARVPANATETRSAFFL